MRSMRACWVTTISIAIGCAACTSDGAESAPLSDERYVAAMNEICADTESRLAALPDPPDAISASDWASEVALAFTAEVERAGALVIDRSIGTDHRTFITTTTDIADRYRTLSSTVDDDPDGVGALTTEITELSLGRDDVAAVLGVSDCVRSAT